MVEELIEAAVDLPELEVRTINLMAGEQFSEEFTRHNPRFPSGRNPGDEA